MTKVFERELNLSIVHWIRKELGIRLPGYFNKPQPDVRALCLKSFARLKMDTEELFDIIFFKLNQMWLYLRKILKAFSISYNQFLLIGDLNALKEFEYARLHFS
ncbi:MAG: hypothetical protein N2202_06275 [Proteobacteria bacterium]|nr:hypothetical protein [Pseudomonadota bacterium]